MVRKWTLTSLVQLFLATVAFGGSPEYQLVNLGVPPEDVMNVVSMALNDKGTVVGYVENSGDRLAFVWTSKNGVRLLDDLPDGMADCYAYDINNANLIAGFCRDANFRGHACIWLDNGTLIDIGALPNHSNSPYAFGTSINDVFQVAGFSIGYEGGTAVIWQPDLSITDLPEIPLSVPSSTAWQLNEIGEAVGTSESVTGSRAIFWRADYTFVDIAEDSMEFRDTEARGVNNLSQVVGWIELSSTPFDRQAYVWDQYTGLQELDSAPLNNSTSSATAINDAGIVVGKTHSPLQRAFIWDNTNGMRNLDNLVDGSGLNWLLIAAEDINSHGWITGGGSRPGVGYRSFLLIPIAPCGSCADSNCDGAVTVSDIGYFVNAVSGGEVSWNNAFPGGNASCDFLCANDVNGDNAVSVSDIGFFVTAITTGLCD